MKRVISGIIIIICSLNFSFGQKNILTTENNYAKEWTKVDSLYRKGLPKSAIEVVEKVYEISKKENNASQIVKSIIYKLKLEAETEEDSEFKAIEKLKKELDNSIFPLKPVLNSMLAQLYWNYYTYNRYKIMNRSVTINYSSDDINTWDVKKFLKEVVDNYLLSLKDAEKLKKVKIDIYDAVISKGEGTRQFRPTLYDFLANRAIDFFMNDEAYLTVPAYKFEIDNPVYFAKPEEFTKYAITSNDTFSLKLYTIKLLQDVVAFHINDATPDALIDAELKRLDFVKTNSTVDDKDSLFLNALLNLKKVYDGKTAVTDIIFKIASVYNNSASTYNPLESERHKWDNRTAIQYCEEAINKFPNSYGAKECRILENNIKVKSLSITNEEANIPSKPFKVLIKYRNSNQQSAIRNQQINGIVYVRIIKLDYDEDKVLQEQSHGKELAEKYIANKPLMEWEQMLPDDGDYQQHSAEIKVPELSYGYYAILTSTSKSFTLKNEVVAYSNFWITNISYIQRNINDGKLQFYLLDRDKGSPLKNVNVQTYIRNYDYNTRRTINNKWKNFVTDKDGYIETPSSEPNKYYGSLTADFKLGNDRYVSAKNFNNYYNNYQEKKKELKTFFFTDRAIYRPGQTIYFKGIMLNKYQDTSIKTQDKDGKWTIAANEKTTVIFYDVNYKEISRLNLTSNEYGSINGYFTAPSGVLTGQMQISNKSGNAYISVEEYKRPKFEILFDTLKVSYKLGEVINFTGKVKSYAGSNVDNAHVKYNVTRTSRFPFLSDWWWNEYIPVSEAMEIKNGELTTDENGGFKINFPAVADKNVNRKYNPVFNYDIHVDVTDINGETHSADGNVAVGYSSIILNTEIQDKIDKSEKATLKFRITNLSGQALETKDSVKIFKLKQPEFIYRKRTWEKPDKYILSRDEFRKLFPYDIYDDEDNISKWEIEKKIKSYSFTSDSKKENVSIDEGMKIWQDGVYMIELSTKDVSGIKVSKQSYFTLYSSVNKQMPDYSEDWFSMIKGKGEPGETAKFMIGSKDKDVRVMYEIESKNKIISKEWIRLNNNKHLYEIPLKEEYRGNISVHFVFVKHNRSYKHDEVITVPYTNKQLDVTFETFRNKLSPGQNEEWKILIKNKRGDKVAAEMLAAMYDASLDAFKANKWVFDLYSSYYSNMNWETGNSFSSVNGTGFIENDDLPYNLVNKTYDALNWFGYNVFYNFRYPLRSMNKSGFSEAPMIMSMSKSNDQIETEKKETVSGKLDNSKTLNNSVSNPVQPKQEPPMDIKIRKNFNETAFFYPAIETNDKGEVVIKFEIPETLTRWKMMGLAYTKDLKYGKIEKELITQKELMITSNPPRFFREGDKMFFNVKISNISDNDLKGQAELKMTDAATMKELSKEIISGATSKDFEVKKGQSSSVSWEIKIPEGVEAITYIIKAKADNYTDGEENTLPVLTNRILVTESMPLPIRGKQTKEFKFDKLLNSGKSPTMRNFKLTLEFTSNPAWYAIQALPYLIETPYESSENLFERYYANSIAGFIMNSNPKIKKVFDVWKNYQPEALLSNLEKNQDLKNVLLQETPWVMQANNESERKQRIGLLFDLNRMTNELNVSLQKLEKLQSVNGGLPWFAGMPESRYFTQFIITGLGRLKKMGVVTNPDNAYKNMISRAIYYLDDRMGEVYDRLKKEYPKDLDKNHLSSEEIQYLYTRSYFDKDVPLRINNREAFDYYLNQEKKYWTSYDIYLEGMISIANHIYGDKKTSEDIIKYLKEKALHSEEMGMYWKSQSEGYYWYQAPIETQAMLIEAFDEVLGDVKSVDEMKAWLLKQKQTQDWKTGKATTEACYALLMKDLDILSSDKLVDITIGKQKIEPVKLEDTKIEAGTGYFRTSWSGSDVKPEMGNITVAKTDEGVAWGGIYWQYFEQLDKITPHKTPLSIVKKLFIERNSPTGTVIEPVSEKSGIKVGDKIKVRIELRSDRSMEYVHLKDMRASGFEPVNVLSGYKYQGGIGYYESTQDAATNFFISYLYKGTYVFEYTLAATQKGDFSNGVTSIQCLYAPEFSAHSEGVRITIDN